MRFLGMSLCCPDPFDKRRDEEAITRRMTEIRHQVNDLLQEGWEVYTVDEVRVEHEAETRRMWLPRGRRTRLYVDREKASQSFFGAPGLTTRKMRIYPIEGNQNTEQTILMMERLQRETDEGKKIAVVLDNARFHHTRTLPPTPPTTIPQNTYGMPPGTTSPTLARSPRRTSSRPSPPTSPTAPSTTTSSTSQPHHRTTALFNSNHNKRQDADLANVAQALGRGYLLVHVIASRR